MLLLAAICISIAKAERFDTMENKSHEIADMLEGRNDAFGKASQEKSMSPEDSKWGKIENL